MFLFISLVKPIQLTLVLGKRCCSYTYKWQRTVVCCTSLCSEVTTIIDTYVHWVSSVHNRGGTQREWCVQSVIWILGVCGVPTSIVDGVGTWKS
jgi:hypothetical protein